MKKLNKKSLTTKKKKIIKYSIIGTLGTAAGTTLAVFSISPELFGATDPSVGSFWGGFFLGFLFVLWYPANRLLAWMKTRQLKNQNLSKDLELKDAKIAALKDKSAGIITDIEEIQE